MYIDESGDHTYSDAKKYLGLTGIIFDNQYYREIFHPALEAFKQRHFPHSPDEPVVLHRREIIDRKGRFGVLRDVSKKEEFNEDLLHFLDEHEFRIISVVIDKHAHQKKYSYPLHPYHYCLLALLERYCELMNAYNVHGDVVAEGRGGREDMKLKEAYRNLFETGSYYHPAKFFQTSLTSREIKIKLKSANVAGLQLADLLAHPCKVEILFENDRQKEWDGEFEKRVCDVIQKKYNKNDKTGRVKWYGKVFIDGK